MKSNKDNFIEWKAYSLALTPHLPMQFGEPILCGIALLMLLGFFLPMECRAQDVTSGKAQQDGKEVNVSVRSTIIKRVTSGISIDGALNEADWGSVEPIGEILQREPKQGEKATERTVVK